MLGMYAPLYAAAGERGIPATVLDEHEPWQAAELLGLGSVRSDNVEAVPTSGGLATRRAADDAAPPPAPRAGRDLIAERMRHAAGEGPEPEADAHGADLARVMATVGRVESQQAEVT